MSGGDTARNLTAGQLRALGVLFMSGSPQEAAEAGNVSLPTLRRWQASAEFSDALRESAPVEQFIRFVATGGPRGTWPAGDEE